MVSCLILIWMIGARNYLRLVQALGVNNSFFPWGSRLRDEEGMVSARKACRIASDPDLGSSLSTSDLG